MHFSCNAHAKQARKEKDGGAIGKASEAKLAYTDEKKRGGGLGGWRCRFIHVIICICRYVYVYVFLYEYVRICICMYMYIM